MLPPVKLKWSNPPIEKIYEAYSAIADGRVKMFQNYALVRSSDNRKEYTIEWEDNVYSSNDNASFYQGYLGYPVIAVLMIQNKIKYSPSIARFFEGIEWKKLNTEHKNKYSKVVDIILADFSSKEINVNRIIDEVEDIYQKLKTLDILYIRSKNPPPK
jgi:hypothetical protein